MSSGSYEISVTKLLSFVVLTCSVNSSLVFSEFRRQLRLHKGLVSSGLAQISATSGVRIKGILNCVFIATCSFVVFDRTKKILLSPVDQVDFCGLLRGVKTNQMLRYEPMAVELRLSILEQISSRLFMILNKHTRQGDKNVDLQCLSFSVVLNNPLQCYRRTMNLLKLEV